MNVMTAASELPFFFAVHESARRVVHEVKGQCTRPSGLDAESANGRVLQDHEGLDETRHDVLGVNLCPGLPLTLQLNQSQRRSAKRLPGLAEIRPSV